MITIRCPLCPTELHKSSFGPHDTPKKRIWYHLYMLHPGLGIRERSLLADRAAAEAIA